jgi:RNA polymerase sigma-70 factor (ECF subfamily)
MNELTSSSTKRSELRLAADDAVSFDRFYASEYRAVLGLAFVLTGDLRLAEDLTQDAFLSAWQGWAQLENPPHWIRAVVSNKARSSWRHRFAAKRAIATLAPSEPRTMLPDDTSEFWGQVRDLPERQAQVVALFYLDDLPVREIAKMLGCKESTARKHLSRGRRNLASRLGVQP